MYGWGLAQQTFGGREIIRHPTWSPLAIPEETINRLAAQAPLKAPPLYLEVINSPIASTPPFTLVVLPEYGTKKFLMSEAVDDSFIALRKRVIQETGYDYLGRLTQTQLSMDHTPKPGQSRRSWNVAGRAFDIWPDYVNTLTDTINPVNSMSPTMEIVREDIGYTVFWRVYMRAAAQDGAQGEPLREAPWDLSGRESGGQAAQEGGEPKAIPAGYYVDLTTLAADYGWERTQALWRWRWYFPDLQYWHFQKTAGLTWWEAMEQIYLTRDIMDSYGPYPGMDN
jgi:hypothetical protein